MYLRIFTIHKRFLYVNQLEKYLLDFILLSVFGDGS